MYVFVCMYAPLCAAVCWPVFVPRTLCYYVCARCFWTVCALFILIFPISSWGLAHIYRSALLAMRVLFEEVDNVDAVYRWFAQRPLTNVAQSQLNTIRQRVGARSFAHLFPSFADVFDMDAPHTNLLERTTSTARLPSAVAALSSPGALEAGASPRRSLPTTSTLRAHSTTDLSYLATSSSRSASVSASFSSSGVSSSSSSSSSSSAVQKRKSRKHTGSVVLSPTATSTSVLEYARCYVDNEFYSLRSPWDMVCCR
jgi:hypothetical protein